LEIFTIQNHLRFRRRIFLFESVWPYFGTSMKIWVTIVER